MTESRSKRSCLQSPAERLQEVVRLVQAGSVLVLTGAGISVGAGIPDFRGSHGLYSGNCALPVSLPPGWRPDDLFRREKFAANPQPLSALLAHLANLVERVALSELAAQRHQRMLFESNRPTPFPPTLATASGSRHNVQTERCSAELAPPAPTESVSSPTTLATAGDDHAASSSALASAAAWDDHAASSPALASAAAWDDHAASSPALASAAACDDHAASSPALASAAAYETSESNVPAQRGLRGVEQPEPGSAQSTERRESAANAGMAKPFVPVPLPDAHLLVEALSERHLLRRWYTQNIDTLELKTVVPRQLICFLHGHLPDPALSRQTSELQRYWSTSVIADTMAFYGDVMREAEHLDADMLTANTLLVMGTSLAVSTAAAIVADFPGHRVLVNRASAGKKSALPPRRKKAMSKDGRPVCDICLDMDIQEFSKAITQRLSSL